MKKLSISLIALAALALGACTSDDIALNDNAGKAVEVGGDGYVSFAINLPTTPVTRGANDVYDDGLAAEYAVNDATLLLFAGESEASAVYYEQYNLTGDFVKESPDDDNITSRMQVTQEISTPASGNIYALVVLNANGLLANISDGSTAGSTATTFSSLQSNALTLGSADAMTKTGFFMCNAPLISTPGGVNHIPASSSTSNSVTTLAVINAENIYSSAAEAEAHPATEIYVERGMAKVTVVDASTSTTVGDTQIPVAINGFTLDITNTKSFLVRNTTGAEDWWAYVNSASGDHRMAGSVEVADKLYRTYWATDPNYDDETQNHAADMNTLEGTAPSLTACADEQGNYNPLYCLENTFNVRHQNDDETTRVIIGATLNNGADFYIWDNDKSTLYTTTTEGEPAVTTTGLDKIKDLILTQLEAEGYMEEAAALWVGPNPGTSDMYDYITIVLDGEGTTTGLIAGDSLTFSYTVSPDVQASWFKPASDDDDAVAAIPNVLVAGTTEYAAVVADLNKHHQVAYYAGGMSYYPVKIKHFGDDLTPWSEEYAGTKGTANEKSYPTSNSLGDSEEEAWLGRYGVLRNNWYEITVTGVSQIGSATVPHAYGEPDDPTESWISIEINILSWAKRTQSVTL